jgi:hypothetical protein
MALTGGLLLFALIFTVAPWDEGHDFSRAVNGSK